MFSSVKFQTGQSKRPLNSVIKSRKDALVLKTIRQQKCRSLFCLYFCLQETHVHTKIYLQILDL